MDHYAKLELKPGATPAEIKQAFRRLAHKYHPDKGGDAAKFKEVREAYEYLIKKLTNYSAPNLHETYWDVGFKPPDFSESYTNAAAQNQTTANTDFFINQFRQYEKTQNDFVISMIIDLIKGLSMTDRLHLKVQLKMKGLL